MTDKIVKVLNVIVIVSCLMIIICSLIPYEAIPDSSIVFIKAPEPGEWTERYPGTIPIFMLLLVSDGLLYFKRKYHISYVIMHYLLFTVFAFDSYDDLLSILRFADWNGNAATQTGIMIHYAVNISFILLCLCVILREVFITIFFLTHKQKILDTEEGILESKKTEDKD